MLPALSAAFSSPAAASARAISAFALAYGLTQLALGPAGDRFGKIKVIACATVVCAVGNLAASMTANLDQLLAARVLSGAAASGIIPLAMAWLGDHVSYEQRHEALAKLLGATVFGMIIGQWAGGVMSATLGWRAAFATLAAVFLLGSLFAFAGAMRLPADEQRERISIMRRARIVLTVPWARIILLVTFLEGLTAFSALAFIPTHLNSSLGLPMAEAGLVAGLYGVGGLAYSSSARLLLRHFTEKGLARLGGLFLSVAYGAIAISLSWLWALPACFAAGFGFHCLHNVLQMNATQMAPQVRGTAVSMFSSSLFLGQSLGVTAAAWFITSSPTRYLFSICSVGLLLVAFATAWFIEARRPARTATVGST
jgi:predicted MFS family arabinose efflux permease